MCVTDDGDAANAHFTFIASADREVVVRIRPLNNSQTAILNGLQWDLIDPSLQPRKPTPAHNDEHVLPGLF